jgi:hypothetical protein
MQQGLAPEQQGNEPGRRVVVVAVVVVVVVVVVWLQETICEPHCRTLKKVFCFW